MTQPSSLAASAPLLSLRSRQTFTMHLRGGVRLPVVNNVELDFIRRMRPRRSSGIGKSSILRMVYGNYSVDHGRILIRNRENGQLEDIASGDPRTILESRRHTIAYVSQFLRAIPRVSAIEVVAEPLRAAGWERDAARQRAQDLLQRLNLPSALFDLPPATFSGGEKQRVNIARGFATDHPLLLLDEPTASLDAHNREVVVEMIEEKLRCGTAILGIFHDETVRDRVATRTIDVSGFSAREAA